jgi:hypothetical protein
LTASAAASARGAQPSPAGAKVEVRVVDRAAARRAGVDGLLINVGRDDSVPAAGRVGLRVDYSAFAGGFGGDYGSRLRLARLAPCALTSPQRAE